MQCGLYNEYYYGECKRHFNVRIGEHIEISPMMKKQVKSMGSPVSDYLLLCHDSPSFESFNVLPGKIKNFLLELQKSLSIMEDKTSLNINRYAL